MGLSHLSLEELADQIETIPSLPMAVADGLRIIDQPNSGPRDLADVLSKDQSLTATLLKFANSAYYGYTRKIDTITEAITILGFNTIRSLLLAASVQKTVGGEVQGYALAQGELWRHSIVCAMTARSIAQRVRFPGLEQAFVAGLIHDIGKVILNMQVAAQQERLMGMVKDQAINFCRAEKEIFGVDHAEVGAMVAEKWNLPEVLVETIAHHHLSPETREVNKLTAIVHIADALCLMLGIGLGSDGLLYNVNPQAIEMLGLSEEMIAEIMLDINEYLSQAEVYTWK